MLFPEEKVIIVLSPESEKLRNAPFIREQITDSWLIIKGDETRADEYKEGAGNKKRRCWPWLPQQPLFFRTRDCFLNPGSVKKYIKIYKQHTDQIDGRLAYFSAAGITFSECQLYIRRRRMNKISDKRNLMRCASCILNIIAFPYPEQAIYIQIQN